MSRSQRVACFVLLALVALCTTCNAYRARNLNGQKAYRSFAQQAPSPRPLSSESSSDTLSMHYQGINEAKSHIEGVKERSEETSALAQTYVIISLHLPRQE